LKKGTFWKIANNTIDIENEELLSCARLRLKSLNPRLCIRKRNIMHLLKKKVKKQKENQE
jgi:hypothetical protein